MSSSRPSAKRKIDSLNPLDERDENSNPSTRQIEQSGPWTWDSTATFGRQLIFARESTLTRGTRERGERGGGGGARKARARQK